MIKRQNFKLPLAQHHLTIRIKMVVPSTVDMVGAQAKWRLGVVEDATGADVLITKQSPSEAELSQDANGKWQLVFELTPVDNAVLAPETEYFAQTDVILASGRVYPANKGVVTTERMM